MYGYAGFRQSIPFGWEKDADGLRGHVVSPISLTLPRSEVAKIAYLTLLSDP
jgi:hypothetical protein